MSLAPHPAAEIFPLMTGADFEALVADIRENGQRDPIVLHDGMILDGRNRYHACQQIGAKPATVKWDGKGTPVAFVISANLRRRHLNESQRAMIAKRLATLKRGDNQHASIEASSQDEAAKLLKVSRSAVQRAAVVQAKAAPELVAAVDRGDIPVSTAAKLVDLPKARQREIAKAGKKTAAKSAKKVKAQKQAKRAAKAPAAPRESQHDRDLRFLQEAWASTCSSAHAVFLKELGITLKAVA